METAEFVEVENIKLLIEIFNLKLHLSEIYNEKGPASSDYISLSLKLDILIKRYYKEKIEAFISIPQDELLETWKQKGLKQPEADEASKKLNDIITKYQKLTH